MKKLGIGLVGYGGIGKVHAMGYRLIPLHYGLSSDAFELIGVATSKSESAAGAAKQLGCAFFTGDYRTLLKREDIHIVDLCTPNFCHEAMVVAAAQAGKHIYCEKPLALNVEQGRRMAREIGRAQVKFQIAFNYRFIPAVVRAKQLVDEGLIGRVFSFHGRYHRSSYIQAEKPLSWRLQRELAGGGVLPDLGSHLLDLIQYLLGAVDQIQATTQTLIDRRPVTTGEHQTGVVDVEDLALMHLRMKNGALGSAEVSRMATGATNHLRLEIFGDQGALHFSLDDPNWVYFYDAQAPNKPLGGQRGFKRIETVQHYEGQHAPDWTAPVNYLRSHTESQYQFLKSLTEDTQPPVGIEAGLRVQQVLEAAFISAATNRWVSIDELSP